MHTEIKRPMRVRHSVVDGNNVTKIFAPNTDGKYSLFRSSIVPITERSAVDSLHAGYADACEWMQSCGCDGISVLSVDRDVQDRYVAEFYG
jgi:hypothetical protein